MLIIQRENFVMDQIRQEQILVLEGMVLVIL